MAFDLWKMLLKTAYAYCYFCLVEPEQLEIAAGTRLQRDQIKNEPE
jgi:hypothetical protein